MPSLEDQGGVYGHDFVSRGQLVKHEPLKHGDVLDGDLHEEVVRPSHVMERTCVGQAEDMLHERSDKRLAVRADTHGEERFHGPADRCLVDHRGVPRDDSGVLEPSNARVRP